MFSHLCYPTAWPRKRQAPAETDDKRRHSWSSDSQFQLPEQHLASFNSIKPDVGSDSSLEGEELRGTNDLDLVGACRTLDHLFIQQRKEVNQSMSTNHTSVTNLKSNRGGEEEASAFRKVDRNSDGVSMVRNVERTSKTVLAPQFKHNSTPLASANRNLIQENKRTLPRIVQVIEKDTVHIPQEDLTSLIVSDHIKNPNKSTKSTDNDLTSLIVRDHVMRQKSVTKPQETNITITQANTSSTRHKQKRVDFKKQVIPVSKNVRIVSEQKKDKVKVSDKKVVSDSANNAACSTDSGRTVNTPNLSVSDSPEIGASSSSRIHYEKVESVLKKKKTPQKAGKISLTWALAEQNQVEHSIQPKIHPAAENDSATASASVQATDENNKCFGYDIQDVDAFLSEGSLRNPANIPMVLSARCTLYQTTHGRQSATILPLGMVVSAIFKNHDWLYVHTPHGEEGYVAYQTCLPLGILPKRKDTNSMNPPAPWEIQDDLFGTSSRIRGASSTVYNVNNAVANRSHRDGLTEITGTSPRRYIFPTTELESTVHREISETFLNKTDSEKLYENFSTTAPRNGRTRRRKQCRTSNNIETMIAHRQSRAKTRSLSANRVMDRNHSSRPRSPTRDLSVDRLHLSHVEVPFWGTEASEHARNTIGRSILSRRERGSGELNNQSATRYRSHSGNTLPLSQSSSPLDNTSGDYATIEPRSPSPTHPQSRATNTSTTTK